MPTGREPITKNEGEGEYEGLNEGEREHSLDYIMYILGTAFGVFSDARFAQMMVGFLSLRGGRKARHATHLQQR